MRYLDFSRITEARVQRVLDAAPDCLVCGKKDSLAYAMITEGIGAGAGLLFCADCHPDLIDTQATEENHLSS